MIFKKFSGINDNYCENIFIHKVIDILSGMLDNNFNFIFTNQDDIELKDFDKTRKNIVIFISDEKGIIPKWSSKVDFIFRTYGNNYICDYKKIFPIPCGFVGPFKVEGEVNNYNGDNIKKPLDDRCYDIFYSGQKSWNRFVFKYFVNRIKKNFNSFIQFNIGFRSGLSIGEYFNIMNNTKIALVPLGAEIPESFRYMEAFESGCIVITTFPRHNPKYNLWYYKDSPAIFLKSWHKLDYLMVKNLLNTESLKNYFVLNTKYYEDFLSPKAVANYIIKTIKNE